MKEITQLELIVEFYKKNPERNIAHPEVVDWVMAEYKLRTGKVFRDPDRAVRQLHQQGFLQKITKGVYRYDPDFVRKRELHDFTQAQKAQIFKRDNYKCVMCGKGRQDGVEIHVDHIKAKEFGGKNTIENGQTLCAQHNFQKKTYKQTETGKKMFIRLHELAKKEEDKKLLSFCEDVLRTFEKHDINGHIVWDEDGQ